MLMFICSPHHFINYHYHNHDYKILKSHLIIRSTLFEVNYSNVITCDNYLNFET